MSRVSLEQPVESAPIESIVYRRKTNDDRVRVEAITMRRRAGAFVLAIIAVVVIAFRKVDYDHPIAIGSELLLNSAVVLAAVLWSRNRGLSRTEWFVFWSTLFVVCLPWIADQVFRSLGYGNGLEIAMMSSLAWGGIVAAIFGRQSRTVSVSVICSGFLTLFTTCTADNLITVWFAYAWGIICMWWLVANHWERVETCAAVDIRQSGRHRIVTIVVGCCAFALVTWSISGRIPVLKQLSAEIMPTSGGSTIYDAAASSGVGDGDALVAAKEHASSFGAVETDVFLDSDQPSLFDVYSDEFGEPFRKNKTERAQALSPQQTASDEGKVAEANRSGSSFSTRRERPTRRKDLKSLTSDALMFWSGRPYQRLAVERFGSFDGEAWHKVQAPSRTLPSSILIGDKTWFKRADVFKTSTLSPYVGAVPEAIKFTRYGSAVVPSLESMQLWHINMVDRTDFFEITADECLKMSGRERVPDYTVVRFVDSETDIEQLQRLVVTCAPRSSSAYIRLEDSSLHASIRDLAATYSKGHSRSWSQVMSVVEGLRRDFKLADDEDDSVDGKEAMHPDSEKRTVGNVEFANGNSLESFFQLRSGRDYHFATAAAAMLAELGFETRFVTGFYTRPRPIFGSDTETAVLSKDMHAWLEVNVGHGYWVPLEPTPGYELPRYQASLWYRSKQAAPKLAAIFCTVIAVGTMIWLCRRPLFELVCRCLWLPSLLLDDRKRVAWLLTLLDWRFKLAGRSRPLSEVPRRWFVLQAKEIAAQDPPPAVSYMQQFFNDADRVWFGALSSNSKQMLTEQGKQAMRWLWHQPLTKYRLS